MEVELDRQQQGVDAADGLARRPSGRSVLLGMALVVVVVASVATFAVLGGTSGAGQTDAIQDLRATQTLLTQCASRSADGVYTGCADPIDERSDSDIAVTVDGDGLGFSAVRTATDGTTFRLRSRFGSGDRRSCEPDGGQCQDGEWR